MNIVSPFLEEKIKDWSPERQDEARRGFGEFLSGIVQSLMVNVRRGFVNRFLDAIGPVEKIKIEFVADQIVEAKDSNRLRSKALIGLVSAFENGIKYALEAAKRGENPSGVIEELHKNVLTGEIQKASEDRERSD